MQLRMTMSSRLPTVRTLRHIVLVCSASAALIAASVPARAASDPPGFAPIPVRGSQVVMINVTCFEHAVGTELPAPCSGRVMFHDVAGRSLKEAPYDLQPGQSTSVRLAIPATTAAGDPIRRILIIPCIVPAPGGRAIPSAEVLDRDAGRVVLYANPAAAHMSGFSDGRTSESSFDPQPDPPGFGLATLRADQAMLMDVTCFPHEVLGAAPSACRGTVMFHDVAGNVIRRASYDLAPGESRAFAVAPPLARPGSLSGIVPCVIPEPGGRAVPSVDIVDSLGNVVLIINPAAARMSAFRVDPLR